MQSNRAKGVKEPQHSREALLSLKRACAFDYLVLASQWESSPFSHLYWWCRRWCSVPILVWEQFDTTEGIPRVLWTGQKIVRTVEVVKSPSSLKHWTHSEPVLWFKIWHQGGFFCQNEPVRYFHERNNSNAPVISATLAFQLHSLWLQAPCEQVSVCPAHVVQSNWCSSSNDPASQATVLNVSGSSFACRQIVHSYV